MPRLCCPDTNQPGQFQHAKLMLEFQVNNINLVHRSSVSQCKTCQKCCQDDTRLHGQSATSYHINHCKQAIARHMLVNAYDDASTLGSHCLHGWA